jgi:hypothetical protein
MIEDGAVKILTGASSFDEIQSAVDLSEDVQTTIGQSSEEPVHKAEEMTVVESSKNTVTQEQETVSGNDFSFDLNNENHPTEEIVLLVDYLKLLEEEQKRNPTANIEAKIERAQQMVISILENTPNLEMLFASRSPDAVVRSEIQSLMEELKKLAEDQSKNPSISIARQIGEIRNTIQSMHREVVK